MSWAKDLKAHDTVYVVPDDRHGRGGSPGAAFIEKVGRKWLTIKWHGMEYRLDRDDGQLEDSSTGWSQWGRVFKDQPAYDHHTARVVEWNHIKRLTNKLDAVPAHLSLEQLHQIHMTLEGHST